MLIFLGSSIQWCCGEYQGIKTSKILTQHTLVRRVLRPFVIMLADYFPNLVGLLFGVHLVESNGVFPSLCLWVNLIDLEVDLYP